MFNNSLSAAKSNLIWAAHKNLWSACSVYFSKMIIEEFGDIQNSSLDFRQYIVGIGKNIKIRVFNHY